MKPKVSIIFLYIASFFASIGPALIYFLINQDKYIKTVPDKVKISAGIVCIAIIIVLKLAGKLKFNSRVAVFGVIFILTYLLESLLNDILIFSFLALIGEVADFVIMIFVKKLKTQLIIDKSASANAQATANEMEKVFERLSGRT